MDNTSEYLKKEVQGVKLKIQDAKEQMLHSVGIRIDDF